jgi:hypothetical protein
VAAQKKAEEKKAKSQNMLHQVEENSLVNSVKVLDGVHVHIKTS